MDFANIMLCKYYSIASRDPYSEQRKEDYSMDSDRSVNLADFRKNALRSWRRYSRERRLAVHSLDPSLLSALVKSIACIKSI